MIWSRSRGLEVFEMSRLLTTTSGVQPTARWRGPALSALSHGSAPAKLGRCCALTLLGSRAMGVTGITYSSFAAWLRRG